MTTLSLSLSGWDREREGWLVDVVVERIGWHLVRSGYDLLAFFGKVLALRMQKLYFVHK